jgi:hypothetical protein
MMRNNEILQAGCRSRVEGEGMQMSEWPAVRAGQSSEVTWNVEWAAMRWWAG